MGLELVAHLAVGDELADLGVAGRKEQGPPHGRRALHPHQDGDERVEDPAGSPILILGPSGHEQPPHTERSLFGPDLVDRSQPFAELAVELTALCSFSLEASFLAIPSTHVSAVGT